MRYFQLFGLTDSDRRNPPPGVYVPSWEQTGFGYRPHPNDPRHYWQRRLATLERMATEAREDATEARRVALENGRKLALLTEDLGEIAEALVRSQRQPFSGRNGR